jgi:hypothetical protein
MARSIREIESRENEAYSTRESESRNFDKVVEYSMEWKGMLEIPPGVEKEGFSYYWATRSIRGADYYEVEKLARRGWTLVPSDRAPSYIFDPLGRNPYCGKYIATEDMALMERPTKYLEMERAALHREIDERYLSCRGVSDTYGNIMSFAGSGYSHNSFANYTQQYSHRF